MGSRLQGVCVCAGASGWVAKANDRLQCQLLLGARALLEMKSLFFSFCRM